MPLAPVETFFKPDYSLDIYLFNLFLYNAVGVLTSYAGRRFRVVLDPLPGLGGAGQGHAGAGHPEDLFLLQCLP